MLEVLGRVGFDWQVAVANFINFVIIFLLLKKFAFGPIQRLIQERQKKIDAGLEKAQQAETDLMMAEELKNRKLDEARAKSNQIIITAQGKGDQIVEKSKEQALKEQLKIRQAGEQYVQSAKDNIRQEMESEMASLVIQGVEKVLQENLTEDLQRSYIKKSLRNYQTQK